VNRPCEVCTVQGKAEPQLPITHNILRCLGSFRRHIKLPPSRLFTVKYIGLFLLIFRKLKMTATEQNLSPAALLGKLKNQDLLVSSGLVAGQWKSGADGKTFKVFEPSSGEVLHECADLGKQDFLDAVDSAEKGTRDFYENTTAKERGAIMRKLYDLMLANEEDCTFILP
jgi:hypothetical protein